MNDLLLTALVSGVFGALGGFLFGLWHGERGRRLDLMWYTDQMKRPADLSKPAEIEHREDPDETARRQAEIAAVKQGLRADLMREGIDASEEDLEQEALRLVTQLNSELGV